MESKLTKHQLAFLSFLIGYIRMVGCPPTVRELLSARQLKSPRSVSQYYDALEKAGFIRRGPGARNIQILKKPNFYNSNNEAKTVHVPVVGEVACGSPITADENIEGQIAVSVNLAKPPHRYFVLKARGDSMDKAGIDNGDYVLVRQQPNAENGDQVVALIDGETTIKEFQRKNGVIILEPKSSRPQNKPIILNEDFMVRGVVVAVIPKTVMRESYKGI